MTLSDLERWDVRVEFCWRVSIICGGGTYKFDAARIKHRNSYSLNLFISDADVDHELIVYLIGTAATQRDRYIVVTSRLVERSDGYFWPHTTVIHCRHSGQVAEPIFTWLLRPATVYGPFYMQTAVVRLCYVIVTPAVPPTEPLTLTRGLRRMNWGDGNVRLENIQSCVFVVTRALASSYSAAISMLGET